MDRQSERRSIPWRAARALLPLGLLAPALVACRQRPTPSPSPLAPPTTIAAPQDVGGAAGTPESPAAGASTTPLPSPTPLRTVGAGGGDGAPPTAGKPTRTTSGVVDLAATATVLATLLQAEALIGKRLEGGVLGRTYHLDDVRTGEHPGFTRIVWAMDEAAGAPYWTTLLRRDTEGTAVIDVALADVSAFDKPDELAAQAVQSPVVDSIQLRRVADDAELRFAIRLARPAHYTVTLLEDPVRIVIDVAHGP